MAVSIGNQLTSRHRRVLYALWGAGRASRRELHQQTGVRPNTVGEDTVKLMQLGLLRECTLPADADQARRSGRPGVPLEIDPSGTVLGISVKPDNIELATLNLRGEVVGAVESRAVTAPVLIGELAGEMLAQRLDDRTVAIGLSTTGAYDKARRILRGTWLPQHQEISIEPIYRAARAVPILLQNDMEALAARWLLQRNPDPQHNVHLMWLQDGNVGGSILVQAHPGVAWPGEQLREADACSVHKYSSVGYDLGHIRLLVDTPRCTCGRVGCLTQICSTRYLRQLDPAATTLLDAAAAYDGTQPATRRIMEYIALAIANIDTTVFIGRIVLISPLTCHPVFARELMKVIRQEVMHNRQDKVTIETWNDPASHPAETAGWLALKGLYVSGFGMM